MKKKIMCLVLILICITGCGKNDSISDITFSNIEDCNRKPELLTIKDDINIYTYCINNIKVNVDNKIIELEKYIKKNKNAIENIIEFLPFKTYEIIDHYTVYNGEKFETSKDSTIELVRCHMSDGNDDIYIGNTNMTYKKNFCKDNNATFTKNYYVEDIQYDSFNTYKIKLKNMDGITESIIVDNWKLVYLEKNKPYEFEFMLNDNVKTIEENAGFIFKNSEIVEIREINKDIDN